jgi:hypothetical protein
MEFGTRIVKLADERKKRRIIAATAEIEPELGDDAPRVGFPVDEKTAIERIGELVTTECSAARME